MTPRLILASGGPGRSGVDTTLRVVSMAADVVVINTNGPSLVNGATSVLDDCSYDHHSWLPRRAGLALFAFADRLGQQGREGEVAAHELLTSLNAAKVSIQVYGDLQLPQPISEARLASLVRQALLKTFSVEENQALIVKTGPRVSALSLSLLQAHLEDCHVVIVRHPVSVWQHLTSSPTDGLTSDEAVNLIFLQSRHCLNLATVGIHKTRIVRFEDLVSNPVGGSLEIADWMGIEYGAAVNGHLSSSYPSDVSVPSNPPEGLSPSKHSLLMRVARELGY